MFVIILKQFGNNTTINNRVIKYVLFSLDNIYFLFQS